MLLIIWVTIMCLLGVADFIGVDWGIKKEYREMPGRKAWQRTNAWSEFLIGISGILFHVIGIEKKWAAIMVGAIVFTVVIFWGFSNRRFHKECMQWN